MVLTDWNIISCRFTYTNGIFYQPAHPCSLINMRGQNKESLDPWISSERTSKTLSRLRGCVHREDTSASDDPKLSHERSSKTPIRLRRCTGWSKSSLSAHFQQFYMCAQRELRSACASTQSDQSSLGAQRILSFQLSCWKDSKGSGQIAHSSLGANVFCTILHVLSSVSESA